MRVVRHLHIILHLCVVNAKVNYAIFIQGQGPRSLSSDIGACLGAMNSQIKRCKSTISKYSITSTKGTNKTVLYLKLREAFEFIIGRVDFDIIEFDKLPENNFHKITETLIAGFKGGILTKEMSRYGQLRKLQLHSNI